MQDLIRSICSAWGVLFRSALVYYYRCSSCCAGGDEIDDIVIFRYRMKIYRYIFFMRAYARIIGIQSLHQSHQPSLAHNRKLPTDHDGNMINILQAVS